MDRPDILMAGASGAWGRALVQRVLRDGWRVTAWAADPGRARNRLGPDLAYLSADDRTALRRAVATADAVVYVWGEGAHARDEAAAAASVAEALAAVRGAGRPAVWVAPEAPGANARDGAGAAWEALTRAAEAAGWRTVRLRPGVVIGAGGGLLARLVGWAQRGVGPRTPSTDAPFAWIHLHDLLDAVRVAVGDERWSGQVRVTAPGPGTVAALAEALARATGRRLRRGLPLPELAGRRGASDAASGPSPSSRPVSREVPAAALGLRIRYPDLGDAVAQAAGVGTAPRIERVRGIRPRRGPTAQYRLTQTTEVPAELLEVFDFFSRAENLGLITPAWTDFRILAHDDVMGIGARIRYRLKVGPFPMRWLTRIAVWEPGRRFVDDQARGPYRLWWHEHRFEAVAGGVRMQDSVLYRVPFGPLGRMVHRLFIAPTLERIFGYRSEAIALRFGAAARARPTPLRSVAG